MRVAAVLVLVGTVFPTTHARTWTDITPYHDVVVVDSSLDDLVMESDPLLFTMSPSMEPSPSPSSFPTTSEPSQVPSPAPTITPRPTTQPSSSPSLIPTTSPSNAPSESPTSMPTQDEFAPNPVPSNPPRGYFNYNPASLYGPGFPLEVNHNATMTKVEYRNNGWAAVSYPEDGYWHEFGDDGFGPWKGVLSRHRIWKNQCANVGKQSPIDIRPNGAECLEHHQIRSRPGDMDISNDTATIKLIERNKLRLQYSRRPCRDYLLPECAEPDPPASDFPNNWGGYTDVMHVDFKVPSEHTVFGKRYDGEMQIFHLHPGRRRTPAVSAMMEASPNAYNFQLQAILDEFQVIYDNDHAQCAQKIRRERRLISRMHGLLGQNVTSKFHDYETWADFSTMHDDPKGPRELQGRFWHPHHVELVPSLYFFGYEGSLTEPPCGEWVSWFITDTPMKLHVRQLEQLQRLIFTHVSPNCERTSVHYQASVARPIQDSFRRPVWRCTSADYPPDSDRTN